MKNLCIDCGKRPASDNHFLCYQCKSTDNAREYDRIDTQNSRMFKLAFRENQEIPTRRVR